MALRSPTSWHSISECMRVLEQWPDNDLYLRLQLAARR
jgi:hypothetical protein